MEYTPEKIEQLRHYCQICHNGKRYNLLGSHVTQKHQMLAREYKQLVGLDNKVPLTSDAVKNKHREDFEKNREKVINNLLEGGCMGRFKKGHEGRPSNKVSKMTLERLSTVHTTRSKVQKKCDGCGNTKAMYSWRKWCDDCKPGIVKARNKTEKRKEYQREWYKEKSKDPEFVKKRTKSHNLWAERNKQHLKQYRAKRNRRLVQW